MASVPLLVVLTGCATREHASPLATHPATASQPIVSDAPPGYTRPLECTATTLHSHPDANQPTIVEVTTVMTATIRVIADNAAFSATQDAEADSQGHASVTVDISRAPIGVPVDVRVEVHLQDAPEAECTTSFTPVVASSPSPAVVSVPSLPFSSDNGSDTTRVPGPQPDIGPSTGGPPRFDCTDATVQATGQLDHGRGTVTVTLRPGASQCDLGAIATNVQLADSAGNVLPVRFIDPMASITTHPPIYAGARMGDDGPGTGEVTHTSFDVVWDGSYCGPPPSRLLLYDSSWVGNAGTPITATLANSSSPCGSQLDNDGSATSSDGTITVGTVGGYPLPSPAWSTLEASIRLTATSSPTPSFVVRLTNPTTQAVPLRPCFVYGVGIVAHDTDGSSDGEAFWGNPDCTKMPSTLQPGDSIDLPVNPTDLDPNATSAVTDATLTWLMPGGPQVSLELP
jgi:hypothetical protein